MIRKTLAAGFMVVALAGLAPAVWAKADFSGTWVLDRAHSEGLPEGMDQTMTVTHKGDRLEVETKVTGPQGDQTVPDTYVLDGKETDFVPRMLGGMGSGTGRRTSRWSADGNGFDVTEKASVDGPQGKADVSATRKWTMSADGKSLTIEMSLKSPQGDFQFKRVFNRK